LDTLTEVVAATIALSDYKPSISCTSRHFGSNTPLPNGPVDLANPPVFILADGDVPITGSIWAVLAASACSCWRPGGWCCGGRAAAGP